MRILYDLIFIIIAIIYLPIYLFKKKFHRGFFLRLGFLPKNLSLDKPVWIHAVSVGEVAAIRGLLEELRKICPEKKFVISTVTATGNKIAKNLAGSGDFITYLPLDFSFIVKSAINKINPAVFILAETEIWPNLISCLYKKNIPIITVNGRISDASFKGYLSIKHFIKPILKKVSFFCVQTGRDGERLIRLGVSSGKIQVTGNMKFDIKDYTDLKKGYIDYRAKLCLSQDEKLLVAGSTHAQEEEMILNVYKELLPAFPKLKLLIAPRHPERSRDIGELVSKFGFYAAFVSTLPVTCSTCSTNSVFILDVIGELMSFYAIADIVFVGGSLVKKGGHNILEPACLGKPILFGPHMFNFRDIADLFLTKRGALKVASPEELKINIMNLLNNSDQAIRLGNTAKQLILQNQGATQRNVEYIRKAIAHA